MKRNYPINFIIICIALQCFIICEPDIAYSDYTWARTYGGTGGDYAEGIQQTSDDGYIVVGYTTSFGAGLTDVWVLNLDYSGNVLWEKTYGGDYYDYAYAIEQTQDGGYIISGETLSTQAGDSDFWIIKLNSEGGIIWQRRYGQIILPEVYPNSIYQTDDGGYIVAGVSVSTDTFTGEISLMKLDSSGNVEWRKKYDGEDQEYIRSMHLTSDGGYIIAGSSYSFGAGASDVWIIKLDATGDIIWQKTYGGFGEDWATDIIQTDDNSYVVAAYTESFGDDSGDFWVIKLAEDGTIIWQKKYGDSSLEMSSSVLQTSDGDYLVAGRTDSFGAGDEDIWIIKLDYNGNIVWQKTYGGVWSDNADMIANTSDGGIVVSGRTYIPAENSSDLMILKIDSFGNMHSSCNLIHESAVDPMDTNILEQDTSVVPVSELPWVYLTSVSGIDSTAISTYLCGCPTVPPPPPSGVTATNTGLNQVTLSWSDVAGALSYAIYRRYLYCGKPIEELIASNIISNYYIDNTVEGDVQYSYTVSAVNQCESMKSPWISITATGDCWLKPCFAGIASIINNESNPCLLTVQWNEGVSSCSIYPDLTYTIYKGTDPDFVPDASNQIAACVAGNSFVDNDVASGLTFYYIVRAEDSKPGSSGPCNGGNFDTNIIKKNGSPTGPVTDLFFDDFETGAGNWNISANWNLNNLQSHNGAYSAHSGNLDNQLCDTITLANEVNLPSVNLPQLHFWTYFSIDTYHDGGIVEGSADGINWTKLSLTPDYPGYIDSSSQPCLGGTQKAYSGVYPIVEWKEYVSDLNIFAGGNIKVRFNYATDDSFSYGGWWIDDVKIDVTESCVNGSPKCTSPPVFNGVTSVINPQGNTCEIILSWEIATSTCPTAPNVSYHIYKSIYPQFTPSSLNRIAECVTGTSFTDNNVAYGQTYYYIVRAEDSSINGTGPCNGGNSDLNKVIKYATPAGPVLTLFSDDFEAGLSNWLITGDWQLSTAQSHSPSNSAFIDNQSKQCDTLTLANYLTPPVNSKPKLSFYTYYNIASGLDGGVIETSSDGNTWTKLNLIPNYPSSTNSGSTACIGTNQKCLGGDGTSWAQYNANLSSYEGKNLKLRFLFATDSSVTDSEWYVDDVLIEWNDYCTTVPPLLFSHKPMVDDSENSAPNGIIEEDETVDLVGNLANLGSAPATSVTGVLTTSDPITINNANAVYPDIAPGSQQNASIPYTITAYASSRPATHWDFAVTESPSCAACSVNYYNYTFHVGNSFADVPPTYLFYSFIEKILHAGVTSGCTATQYCPELNVERQQMAKFMCRSMETVSPGSCVTSSWCGTFDDVPPSNIFCSYIEAIYDNGVANGCQANPPMFCPSLNTQRQEMAKFVCNAMEIALPGACVPAGCAGIFTDVPSSNHFCPFIEELYNEGVISGCSANAYCPSLPVSRAQMSKFIVNGFGFTL